jgi:hypothetical protein
MTAKVHRLRTAGVETKVVVHHKLANLPLPHFTLCMFTLWVAGRRDASYYAFIEPETAKFTDLRLTHYLIDILTGKVNRNSLKAVLVESFRDEAASDA